MWWHLGKQPTPNIHQESDQEQNINQEADIQQNRDQRLDPDVHLDVQPNPDIPHRVTRSKNNISKNNTKYDKDYVIVNQS